MGGHAGFVWPAFAIAAIVLIGLAVAGHMRLKSAERELAELEQIAGRRREQRPARPGN